MNPVNKQASIFLSRPARVDTLQAAIDKFLTAFTGPEVAKSIRALVESGTADSEFTLTLKIRKDSKNPGMFVASTDSKMSTRVQADHYFGLRP